MTRNLNNIKYDILLHMGDFNFNDIDWKNQSTNAKSENLSTKFLDIVQESFLHQHVMSPTRQKMGNKPSILDYDRQCKLKCSTRKK